MYKRTLGFLMFALCLTACNKTPVSNPVEPPDDTSPRYVETQETVDRLANEGNLAAQAVKASGLYNELSTDDYPFLLMLVESNTALEAYLSEQGLSKETFLAHPKLRNFIEHNLIDSYVDIIKIRSTQNTEVTYTSAAGSDIVLTTAENLDPQKGDVMFANGVPVEAYCFISGNGGEDDMQSKGLLCFADAPVMEFDWSE